MGFTGWLQSAFINIIAEVQVVLPIMSGIDLGRMSCIASIGLWDKLSCRLENSRNIGS